VHRHWDPAKHGAGAVRKERTIAVTRPGTYARPTDRTRNVKDPSPEPVRELQ
jgi:hypothetical protein